MRPHFYCMVHRVEQGLYRLLLRSKNHIIADRDDVEPDLALPAIAATWAMGLPVGVESGLDLEHIQAVAALK